jgi:hypothetical protein
LDQATSQFASYTEPSRLVLFTSHKNQLDSDSFWALSRAAASPNQLVELKLFSSPRKDSDLSLYIGSIEQGAKPIVVTPNHPSTSAQQVVANYTRH